MQLEKSGLSGNETTPLEEIRQMVAADEDMGYEAPFTTLTWEQWLEMHARIFQSMMRFQRAMEHGQLDVALFAGLEIHEVATQILKEASAAVGRSPRAVRQPCLHSGRTRDI